MPGLEEIFKLLACLLSIYGGICGVLKAFLPGFTVGGLFGGIIIIILCGLLLLSELRQIDFLAQVSFINESWGKGGLLVVVGALFATNWPLWIANWVIFWFFGAVFICIWFVLGSGLASSAAARNGFQEMT
jgi:hypothetical protein